ncbi:MAG: formate dehydrogenase accessory sulfurtransferase FdhD [Kineosporiaceae bacterium]
MATTTARRPVVRFADGHRVTRPDTLAVEEPLEIRLDRGAGAETFTVTMRTPGHDVELALGFLVSEGIARRPADVVSARHCPAAARDGDGVPTHNVVEVRLRSRIVVPAGRQRRVSSACGICGTASIDAVRTHASHSLADDDVMVGAATIAALPERLRTAQRVFDRTGGLHAAGLFTSDGELVVLREDVGRHNAVDKVVGWGFGRGLLPLRDHVLQVSGRASFELVQKAWTAGCPVLAAVSAPSSLAVDLATDAGLTLVGFSRGASFNVYAGARRITD